MGWPILSADNIGRRDRYYRPIYRYRSYTSLGETIHYREICVYAFQTLGLKLPVFVTPYSEMEGSGTTGGA